MSKLIGKEVDESFGLFPPFYTDCGKNIEIGMQVPRPRGNYYKRWCLNWT